MVPSRLRIPTPAWAEMPPPGAPGDDVFRPFTHGDGFERVAVSHGAHSFDSPPCVRSGHEDDDTPPQLGLF